MSPSLLKPIFFIYLSFFGLVLYGDDTDKPIQFRGLEGKEFSLDSETPLSQTRTSDGLETVLLQLQSQFYAKYDHHNVDANDWRKDNMTPVFDLLRRVQGKQAELWKKYGNAGSDFRVPGFLCGPEVRLRYIDAELEEVEKRLTFAESQKNYFYEKYGRNEDFNSWLAHETRLVELRSELRDLKWKFKDLRNGISAMAGNLVKMEIPATPMVGAAKPAGCPSRFGLVAEAAN